jgi:hypothetical protein
MKYAVEMDSGAIYITGLLKIGSGIRKLIWGDSQTAWNCCKSTFMFFSN